MLMEVSWSSGTITVVPPLNNPAARLAGILRQIRDTDPNISIRAALGPILGSATGAEFARSVGHLLELPDKVCAAVTAAADPEFDDVDWHLQWKAPVDRAMANIWNLDLRLQGVSQCFSDADVVNVEACSQLLSRARIERRIEPSTLEDLRQKTQDLHDALMDADDLPASLKSFMLDQLDRIARALREFVIRGPESLTEAVDGAVGASIRVAKTMSEPITPVTQSWLEKFKTHLAVVATSVGVATSVLALPGAVDQAVDALNGSSSTSAPAEHPAAESNGYAGSQPSIP